MSSVVALVDWGLIPESSLQVDGILLARPERSCDGRWVRTLGPCTVGLGLRATTGRQRGCAEPIFCDERNQTMVVCDARIDNFDELARDLGIDPFASDAELIATAYARWDLDTARRLDGDFAFAVWDQRRSRLFAARDRFGVRTLCFRETAQKILVATEVGQVIADPDTPRDLDDLSLLDHLTWQYGYHRLTFFRAVTRIEPGHYLVGTQGGASQCRYWHPETTSRSVASVDEYAHAFATVLEQAVRERMTAPSPVLTCALIEKSPFPNRSAVVANSRIQRRKPRLMNAY